jgi:hypothetical protein
MKNFHNKIANLKKIVSLSFFVLCFANVSSFAKSTDAATSARLGKAESVAIAAKSLSQKLKSDLVLQNVAVKFTKTENYFISKTQIGIKGEGICQFDGKANDLPVNFDVKIDVSKRAATEVKYVFLNMEGAVDANSAVAAEDIVTEKLLQKIKNDYKTQNIVIALDYVNEQTLPNGEKGFTGAGEVRVNGMIWQKISFDAKAGQEKTKLSVVKYQIK